MPRPSGRSATWLHDGTATAGILITLGLLAVAGAASFLSLHQVGATARHVEHTQAVLRAVDSLHTALLDAEADQRGFQLSGDLTYLAGCRAALPRRARPTKRCACSPATIPSNSTGSASSRRCSTSGWRCCATPSNRAPCASIPPRNGRSATRTSRSSTTCARSCPRCATMSWCASRAGRSVPRPPSAGCRSPRRWRARWPSSPPPERSCCCSAAPPAVSRPRKHCAAARKPTAIASYPRRSSPPNKPASAPTS